MSIIVIPKSMSVAAIPIPTLLHLTGASIIIHWTSTDIETLASSRETTHVIMVMVKAESARFIKPCQIDWRLNRCAISNGNEAIPSLAIGSPTIAPIDPLQLASITVNENGPAVVRANMTFKELYAYGLNDSKINRSDIDLRAKHMVWMLKVPRILFGFKYKINGHVNSLPIMGTGNGVIEFDDVELVYLLDFDVANISGVEYVEVVHTEIRHTVQLLRIQLDNLFNGNKTLGDQMNVLLNEYWVELNKQLGPPIDKAFTFSLKPIVDYILTSIPFDQLFPK
uniref:Protein takeout n=1 Tax=Lygus hesperus TaxID=30085 RepID=A0A146LI02_LYGHE